MREQDIRLFGFISEVEREWFRLLQLVQGVGARVALAVLGTLKPGDLASAIALQDKGDDRARARRRPEDGGAHLRRAEGQGAGVLRAPTRGWRGCNPISATASRRSRWRMRSRRWSISATGRCRPPRAISAALREAGDGAETARLIRLGLKELAR